MVFTCKNISFPPPAASCLIIKKKEEERAGEMSDKVNFIVSEEKGVGANKKLQ